MLVAFTLVGVAGCGLDSSATFNADGSVTIGLKFLIPAAVLDSNSGVKVTGLNPGDLAASQAKLQQQYPGAKITSVTEGDEAGALVTVPFKDEKDAFAFLTAPSRLSPAGATSGSGVGLNLSNTGGLFKSASHTTSGASDTYTFVTVPPPTPSPSPGTQTIAGTAALESVFVITFALTVPHVITSAPGALFTLDRHTAIWKLSLISPETLTATTGPATGTLVAAISPSQEYGLALLVGLVGIAVGFALGMLLIRRGLHRRETQPVAQAYGMTVTNQPASPAPAQEQPPVAWPGPPPDAPPPTKLS